MANFRTHVTVSTALGVGYGALGVAHGASLTTSAVAAGLCGVAGMLPDLDSDSGVPVRETMSFVAAVAPMLMIERFERWGWSPETMVLAGGLIYLAIRFGVGAIFKSYTVHRGMWHSVPAALSVALVAFLLCAGDDMRPRLFKVGGVFLGFMSHLVLDEIYAVDLNGRLPRVKRSFGTALKFFGADGWANFSTYAKLLVLVALAFNDPLWMQNYGYERSDVPHTAEEILRDLLPKHDEERLLR